MDDVVPHKAFVRDRLNPCQNGPFASEKAPDLSGAFRLYGLPPYSLPACCCTIMKVS